MEIPECYKWNITCLERLLIHKSNVQIITKARYFVLGVRLGLICELPRGKHCSRKCCWKLFSGKTKNGLNAQSVSPSRIS